MAALSANTLPWHTDEEFRVTIALIHEITHLAQDLTTGLGHADYLTHKTKIAPLLRYASVVVQMDKADRPPYRSAGSSSSKLRGVSEDPIVAAAFDELRYSPFSAMPHNRVAHLRSLIGNTFNNSIDDQTLFDLSTQSLLESDAALSLLRTIDLEGTDAQRDVSRRNRGLLDPQALGPEYWKAFVCLNGVVKHHCALSVDELKGIIDVTFGFFVDCVLAYPPGSWIEARGESPNEYDPSVKFARLLSAFQKLSGKMMEEFWKALFSGRYKEAEAILFSQSSFTYTSSEIIYQEWLKALEPRIAESVVAELRYSACRFRLDHGILMPRRDINLIFNMQAPLIYIARRGFTKYDWGSRNFDGKGDSLVRELVDDFMIMEMVDFLFRTGEFRCPQEQADICSATEDCCFSGIVHLAQFPDSSDCRARQVLNQCDIDIPSH